ncbi:hypothetical protein [Ideonella sp.]|uniref:hypothetical protein n=1 Tax=Ideonella sp. TaxID=1929293 RepID=UPI0035B0650A
MQMTTTRSALGAVALACAMGTASAQIVPAENYDVGPATVSCPITENSIGPLRIGMTLGEARKAWPAAKFERRVGLDDLVELAVVVDGQTLVISGLGYDIPPGALPEKTVLQDLATYHPWCKDSRGIGPGTLLSDAASAYGGLVEIGKSDIEEREYARFKSASEWMHFRVDYTSIFYPESPRRTTAFKPEARLMGVEIGYY